MVEQINIIEREDSLQMISAMSPADRDAFIKKLVRQYRKERGLKDDNFEGNSIITFNNDKSGPVDLFASTSNPSKGEWYFYNASLKSRGFNEFKAKWGKRLNVDNWRRKSSSDALINRNSGGLDPFGPIDSSRIRDNARSSDISFEAMSANIPLTTERLDSSNSRIALAMLELGKLFQFEMQDHYQAIETFEIYLNRFPALPADQAYLGLYYSYTKLGNTTKATTYKNMLVSKYPQSNAAILLVNPASTQPNKKILRLLSGMN